MRVFIFVFFISFLYSCSKNSEDPKGSYVNEEDNVVNPIEALVFEVVGDYNGNLWEEAWTQYVYDNLDFTDSGLLQNEVDEDDLKVIKCENYNSFPDNQKKMFWALFMSAVSHFESSFNEGERYYEISMGKYSEGLFQLSTSDSSYYSNCDIDSSNILDPEENIRCAVSILDIQIEGSNYREPGRLFPDSYFYWSVLTRASTKTKVQNFFKERVKEILPFCY